MAKEKRFVGTEDVRRWAREKNWTDSRERPVGERGRVSTELVSAFNGDTTMKRRNIGYEPGREPNFALYEDVNGPVADAPTRQPAKATPARAAAAPSKAVARQEKATAPTVTPIRVPATRGEGRVNSATQTSEGDSTIMGVAEAIETLEAMAKTKKGNGRPVLMTIQTLAYV